MHRAIVAKAVEIAAWRPLRSHPQAGGDAELNKFLVRIQLVDCLTIITQLWSSLSLSNFSISLSHHSHTHTPTAAVANAHAHNQTHAYARAHALTALYRHLARSVSHRSAKSRPSSADHHQVTCLGWLELGILIAAAAAMLWKFGSFCTAR